MKAVHHKVNIVPVIAKADTLTRAEVMRLKKKVRCLLLNVSTFIYTRVPTPQGKQGKWPKKIPSRENTENLEILPKHMEFGLLKL